MNLSAIATRSLGSVQLGLQKNAPTILTGAGIVGFIATTALTIRATTKAVDALPVIAEDVRIVKQQIKDDDVHGREAQKELVKVYAHSSLVMAEIFWPALLTGSASIACVIAAHGMMVKRQASLVAAYTALDAGYRAYRSRVREEFGEEKELALYRNPKTRTVYDDEMERPCEIIDTDDTMPSPYARFFDECSPNWTKTPEYNLMFLRAQQDWANDRLHAHGYLFLNEVYEALGLQRSQAGQIVGWQLKGNGDGFVDFGLYAIGDECNRAFVNIIEHTVLLDFNVDGVIKI